MHSPRKWHRWIWSCAFGLVGLTGLPGWLSAAEPGEPDDVQYVLTGHSQRCRCQPRCEHAGSCPHGAVAGDEATGDMAPADESPLADDLGADSPDAMPPIDSLASSYGVPRGPSSIAPGMLGDFLPGAAFSGQLQLAGVNIQTGSLDFIRYGNSSGLAAVPFAFHTMKSGEGESPWPRNRVYVSTNYYDNLGGADSITRNMVGLERRILGGQGSIGMRLPFFTVDPGVLTDSRFVGGQIGTFGAGTNTQSDVGDLSIVFKYSPVFRPATGHVGTLGLIITPPTGPDTLADVDPLFTVSDIDHDGMIQPFAAFYQALGRPGRGWFIHGFSSLDIPFDQDDSTFLITDLGVGCFIPRNKCRGLTAIVPTLEVHANTPLDDRVHGVVATPLLAQLTSSRSLYPLGFDTVVGSVEYHNQVNLTSGVSFVFNRRSTLALGVVSPLTGPNPFDFELQAQFTCYQQ